MSLQAFLNKRKDLMVVNAWYRRVEQRRKAIETKESEKEWFTSVVEGLLQLQGSQFAHSLRPPPPPPPFPPSKKKRKASLTMPFKCCEQTKSH